MRGLATCQSQAGAIRHALRALTLLRSFSTIADGVLFIEPAYMPPDVAPNCSSRGPGVADGIGVAPEGRHG